MISRIGRYLVLPKHLTEFERTHLARINRIALIFFWLHLPVFMAVAAIAGTNLLKAALLIGLMLVGPTVAYRTVRNPRHLGKVFAVTAMGMGGLLVHFGQGPMQIEMHFYFFVTIALLSVFANPMVIVTAAVTVVAHHGLLYFLLPSSVFNYEASLWSVAVHGLFVIVESVAACFVARNFFDSVIGLERIVEGRTKELARHTQDLKLVLDNVDQGFLTLAADGSMARGRSAILERWLGPSTAGEKVWTYISRSDANVASALEAGFSALDEDVLPIELVLDQMPKRWSAGGSTLELAYKPIFERGKLSAVLVVFTDVTARLEQARMEEEHLELLAVYRLIVKDKAAFREAMSEAGELVTAIADLTRTEGEFRRNVHTLKGNAELLGLTKVSAACHALEESFAIDGFETAKEHISELWKRWQQFVANVDALFGDTRGKIELSEEEYATLLVAIESGAPRVRLLTLVEDMKRETADSRLQRLAEQARGLAQRLAKGRIEVLVESNGVKLEQGECQVFWSSLAHLIRNAIDHGIESPEERRRAGKTESGTLVLTTTATAEEFMFQIRDDGRGIDWNAVQTRAMAHGLETRTHDQLVDALFVDGLSTKSVANEYSGRGIGLSAVRKACEDMGGHVTVISEAGKFTTVRLRVARHSKRTRRDSMMATERPAVRLSKHPNSIRMPSLAP